MPDDIPMYYWDACVLLSYLEGRPDRIHDISAFLNDAENGRVSIVTSDVSIVEVAFVAHERKGGLSVEAEAEIESLWAPGSVIQTVDFNKLIARAARRLIRESVNRGWQLKPLDAVHLATARFMKVEHFHTYDRGLDKYGPLLGFEVGPPRPGQLPIPLEPGEAQEAPGDA